MPFRLTCNVLYDLGRALMSVPELGKLHTFPLQIRSTRPAFPSSWSALVLPFLGAVMLFGGNLSAGLGGALPIFSLLVSWSALNFSAGAWGALSIFSLPCIAVWCHGLHISFPRAKIS